MTTREQAIEIAAKKMFADADAIAVEAGDDPCEWGTYDHQDWYRRRSTSAYDALLAAGVIPAEGMVVVDANVANKIVRMWDARANLKAMQLKNARRMATSQSACDEVNRAGFSWQAAWEAITDDDINAFRAIPDAPAGEGER